MHPLHSFIILDFLLFSGFLRRLLACQGQKQSLGVWWLWEGASEAKGKMFARQVYKCTDMQGTERAVKQVFTANTEMLDKEIEIHRLFDFERRYIHMRCIKYVRS